MTERLTLSVREAAARLDVTPEWLAEAARRGDVPSRKVGRHRRFTEADLIEYLERVKQGQDPLARNARSRAAMNRKKAS